MSLTLPLLLLLLLLLLTTIITTTTTTPLPSPSPSPSSSYPYGFSYHIDCGSPTNTTDPFNTTWLSDRYFSGGATSIVSEPLLFQHPHEKTLRFFPTSSGKKNCYTLPLPPPSSTSSAHRRFLLRTFVVYDNYDGKAHPPSFDVSVRSTIVFSWRSPWPSSLSRRGAYSDLLASSPSDADAVPVCFYSFATDPPVISSLEVFSVDPNSYDAASTATTDIVLVNYGRLSCGSGQWGPGFSADSDRFGRSWQADSDYRTANSDKFVAVSTKYGIKGTDQKPNYFPEKLYQTAVTTAEEEGGVIGYELSVDAKLDYLLWLHFAEIEGKVRKAGERVFDVWVNDENLTRIDIYRSVGGFAAYTWHHTVKNLSSSVLSVKLKGVKGAPLICGVENYALVPNDPSTVPQQAVAMKALKDSLRIPERMGWNGDPCAPTNWDAWEGVTCRMSKDNTGLVISQIDLGSQGLKGDISDQISLLSDLVSLNLSSNSLMGEIPNGLGQKSLIHLDLSNNQLTGSIPDSIASSSLKLVLLNGNLLEGRVPEELYSIGVHGGAIDLSSNKGLCGVPTLPSCPIFWENGRLSTRGKIAIGLSCFFVFCVVVLLVFVFIRRRRNDYDFALPHELTSLAAKRNRYQRQKSLMLLEMESQHAKGLVASPYTQQ
ncbi:receptor-like protein 4 isoform X1 [Arachis duranensis]|uniref:Receptor-like protein 4 isoform X1 n=1 Tax=Arachis duranensis TaxID=130453 RepID=A0A6P4DIN4_ARADU|nr:receptor-like protein 4 isoform X1 [Arachis duranensis]